MKHSKITALLAGLLIFSSTAFAEVNFSAVTAGSVGFYGDWRNGFEFGVPLNVNAKAQINFSNWGILRADFSVASPNIGSADIFKNTALNAFVSVNEISFSLIKGAGDYINYFGFYVGTYDTVGRDTFLQRQFGINPISSDITKSASSLESGYSLYDNYGFGFNYTLNFGKTPAVFGISLYFDDIFADINMNVDLRTAFTFNMITLDLAVGIDTPLTTKTKNPDVFLAIDTIYLHGGLNMLLGSKYTHSFLLQAGIQNVKLSAKDSGDIFSPKDLTCLAEVRIYTKPVKYRVTGFSLPKECVQEALYIDNAFGAGITVFSDAIPLKNETDLTVGAHLTGSFEDTSLMGFISDMSSGKDITEQKLDASITPYVIIPLFGGNFEVMAQFGMSNILKSPTAHFKTKVGYKKSF